MNTISLKINSLDAAGIEYSLNDVIECTASYELSEIIKSVNNAFVGVQSSESDKLKAMHNFNNFMAVIGASRESIAQLHNELKTKIN
jgi:hypothetical protein